MLPAMNGTFLPVGDHQASWADVEASFGGNQRRQAFCERLKELIDRARNCGFLRVYVFGSFISAKPDPGDVDLMWVYRSGLDFDTLSQDCRDLLNYATMKAREGWDIWCCSDDPAVLEDLLSGWRKSKPPGSMERGIIFIRINET